MIVVQTIDTKEILGVYSTEQEAIDAACKMRQHKFYNVEVHIDHEETSKESTSPPAQKTA